ncbi:hypothetical protein CRM22_010991, partial [Opisthorchis felineus]
SYIYSSNYALIHYVQRGFKIPVEVGNNYFRTKSQKIGQIISKHSTTKVNYGGKFW